MTRRDSRSRWDQQDQLVMDTQTVVQRSGAHLLLLAHASSTKGRGVKDKDDVIVQLSDIKGHTEAFQDLANALSIYRPRSHDREDLRDEQGLFPSAVVSLKQRMEYGREGIVEMKVDTKAARFVDPRDAFGGGDPL
jgi:hypothetical protein